MSEIIQVQGLLWSQTSALLWEFPCEHAIEYMLMHDTVNTNFRWSFKFQRRHHDFLKIDDYHPTSMISFLLVCLGGDFLSQWYEGS